MCFTTDKYQTTIQRLETEIYPALHEALNDFDINEAEPLSDLIKMSIPSLQKEFHSLETYETKLIFPAILALVNDSNTDKYFSPDISGIINLTQSKEDRLNNYINQIAAILDEAAFTRADDADTNLIAGKLQYLTEYFYNQFLPAKQVWKHLLSRLEAGNGCKNRTDEGACNCKHN
jgi:hypothetical protein